MYIFYGMYSMSLFYESTESIFEEVIIYLTEVSISWELVGC